MALREIQNSKKYEVVALLTTITKGYDRVSMHGIRRILIERQAESLGYPLEEVFIKKNSSTEEYGSKMKEVLTLHKRTGIASVVFGDIFLEDVRAYREENLSKIGMNGIFPLWKKDTAELARNFVDLGFKAVVTCVDLKVLGKKFAGKDFDERFLSELPSNVDPCGEKGEFHSFVFDGPPFRWAVQYRQGRIVLRDKRFYYCDLLPVKNQVHTLKKI